MTSEAKIAEVFDRMRTDLLFFGKFVNPSMFYKPSPEFHRELGVLLLSKTKFINIIAPRGTAKSSLAAEITILHHIIFGEGKKVIVIASKTQGHAKNRLQAIKDILDYSETFREAFGYWGRYSAKKYDTEEVVLKDDTYIVTKGTGQQLRGLKYGNQRPTLVVLDDPEDENNTKTKEAMENNLKWVLQSSKFGLDADKGRIIIIGTPQHEMCAIMQLKRAPGWETRHYKYLNQAEDGSVYSLWPDMYSVDYLQKEKAEYDSMGKLSYWYRERQCEIVGDADQVFRPEYFRWWRGDIVFQPQGTYIQVEEVCRRVVDGEKQWERVDKLIPVNTFLGVDPASTTSQQSDYTAMVALGYDANGNRWLHPYSNKRMTPMNVALEVERIYNLYKPVRGRIESNGYQEMLREYLKDTLRIPGFEYREVARDKKDRRIESMEPFFAKGTIYLREGMSELEDQLLLYPRSRHDDLLDALYYACKGNFPPMHEVPDDDDPTIRFYPLKNRKRRYQDEPEACMLA